VRRIKALGTGTAQSAAGDDSDSLSEDEDGDGDDDGDRPTRCVVDRGDFMGAALLAIVFSLGLPSAAEERQLYPAIRDTGMPI
jgi:hypothetical protein